jgi:hypothetical protein
MIGRLDVPMRSEENRDATPAFPPNLGGLGASADV